VFSGMLLIVLVFSLVALERRTELASPARLAPGAVKLSCCWR